MYEGDAAAVRQLSGHLVPQDRSGSGAPDLLHVAAAEPAREDADDLSVAFRLGDVCELGETAGIEDDGSHGSVS
jgi:hypothetical protein